MKEEHIFYLILSLYEYDRNMRSENTCLLAVAPITNCPVSILNILKFLNIVKLYFFIKVEECR